MFKFRPMFSRKQIKWAQSSMSAESYETEKILVLFCTKKTSCEGKKHRKRSSKRRQGWGSCHLNLNVALVLHHAEVNVWVSPCVLTGLLSSFGTYSQTQWTASWKFYILFHWLQRQAKQFGCTAALILAKAAFNITSYLEDQAVYGDGNRVSVNTICTNSRRPFCPFQRRHNFSLQELDAEKCTILAAETSQ